MFHRRCRDRIIDKVPEIESTAYLWVIHILCIEFLEVLSRLFQAFRKADSLSPGFALASRLAFKAAIATYKRLPPLSDFNSFLQHQHSHIPTQLRPLRSSRSIYNTKHLSTTHSSNDKMQIFVKTRKYCPHNLLPRASSHRHLEPASSTSRRHDTNMFHSHRQDHHS
jgi:hypothetical protein